MISSCQCSAQNMFSIFYLIVCVFLHLFRLIFFHSTSEEPFSLFCILIQITQFLDSQGFLYYVERVLDSDENNYNLLDKLQDAIGRGENPMSILPSSLVEPEIITISDPGVGISGTLVVNNS